MSDPVRPSSIDAKTWTLLSPQAKAAAVASFAPGGLNPIAPEGGDSGFLTAGGTPFQNDGSLPPGYSFNGQTGQFYHGATAIPPEEATQAGIDWARAKSGAAASTHITVVPSAVQAPQVAVPNMPGYSYDRVDGHVVGPDGRAVDPAVFAQLVTQAQTQAKQPGPVDIYNAELNARNDVRTENQNTNANAISVLNNANNNLLAVWRDQQAAAQAGDDRNERAREERLSAASTAYQHALDQLPAMGQMALDEAKQVKDIISTGGDAVARMFMSRGGSFSGVSQADMINGLGEKLFNLRSALDAQLAGGPPVDTGPAARTTVAPPTFGTYTPTTNPLPPMPTFKQPTPPTQTSAAPGTVSATAPAATLPMGAGGGGGGGFTSAGAQAPDGGFAPNSDASYYDTPIAPAPAPAPAETQVSTPAQAPASDPASPDYVPAPAPSTGGFTATDAQGPPSTNPWASWKWGGLASGGFTRAGKFLGNEQGAETFLNPTHAPITVINHEDTMAMADKPRGFATGTGIDNPNTTWMPGSQQYAGMSPVQAANTGPLDGTTVMANPNYRQSNSGFNAVDPTQYNSQFGPNMRAPDGGTTQGYYGRLSTRNQSMWAPPTPPTYQPVTQQSLVDAAHAASSPAINATLAGTALPPMNAMRSTVDPTQSMRTVTSRQLSGLTPEEQDALGARTNVEYNAPLGFLKQQAATNYATEQRPQGTFSRYMKGFVGAGGL